jgi:hypothetical protein
LALTVTHAYTATGADDPEAEINRAEWNADHVVVGGIIPATVTLESADILALYTTPFTVVPAPGAGKWVEVHRLIATMNYVTTTYIVTDGVYVARGTQPVADVNSIVTAGSSLTGVYAGLLSTFFLTDADNEAIVIRDDVGDPIDGDGTLTVTVWYSIEDVP